MINRLAHALLLLALACGEEDKGTGPVPEPGPDPVSEPDPEAALFAAEVAAVREGCEDGCILAVASNESDDYGACYVSCVWESEKELWKVRMLEVLAEFHDQGIEVGFPVSDLPDKYFLEIIGSGDTPRTWVSRLALTFAAMAGDGETVRFLLNKGPICRAVRRFSFCQAVRQWSLSGSRGERSSWDRRLRRRAGGIMKVRCMRWRSARGSGWAGTR